jgi:signal transduction histidine kinase/ligand-binding sensor domain-containing protein/DNA-binding response OmpR family regulator
MKDGLPVNAINALLQDRAGYIWAATFDGLVRFDGMRFTVFNTATSDELPSDRIIALTEGHDGSLWLATEQLELVRFRAGRFTKLAFDHGKPRERVAKLFVDSAGTVWVGTTRGLWAVRGDRLVPIARETLDAHVSSIVPRRDGSLWLGTANAGVFRLSPDGRVTSIATTPALAADTIARMAEDAAGVLWVAGRHALWSLGDRPVRVRSPRSDFAVANLVQDPATGALLAETDAGIYRIAGDSTVLVQPRPQPTNGPVGLWADARGVWTVVGQDLYRDGRPVFTFPERPAISSTLLDREGGLWLGTESGLHRLMPPLLTTYSVPDGVAQTKIYATYVDRSGAVWLGTPDNGASRVDPATGRVTSPAMGARTINSFYEDASERLWVGTGYERADGGVFVCTSTGTACRAEGPPELRRTAVFALHGDADGRLWAGAVGGLYRYDGRTWTRLPASSGAPEATVRAFAETRDGALWMGTNGGGLARYREGTFTHVTRANGLPSDLVRSLYQDGDGWLWVGTEGRGLARVDPRAWGTGRASTTASTRIVRVGAKDGLYDEVIHQILEDDAGRLWMNTNRGIFWVARAELNAFADGRTTRIHSTAYTERDGMRNREGNGGVQPAGAKGRDGRLWFPTQDGVVVVDPAMVRHARRALPLVVERVVAGGRAVAPQRDSVALTPDQRDVQIEYTALTFTQPANVRFRYRLEGYDAGWVDAGSRRTAFYTKLPPRRYTFRVEASDAAGGWREPGAALAVGVLPRFAETGVFRWASVAAFGLLLLGAFRLREARLRMRAARLERVVDERTAALRERERELAERNADLQSLDRAKTNFFANVSHELRTPLTLTIGPLEDLRARAGGDAQVERWLDIALRNARRVLRLVNQILDVAKLEAGAMRLEPRPVDLAVFTRGVVAAFGSVAEHKGIRLTAETPETLRGAFDADAFEKILTNLLSNAVKVTTSAGPVHVALLSDGSVVRLLVRDSGPGIPADQLAHVFERFYQVDESATHRQPGTGIGLSLVKELVELHGGTIEAASGGTGTTFTATLPMQAVADGIAPPEAPESTDAAGRAAVAATVMAEHDGDPAEPFEEPAHSEDVPTLLVVDDSADLRRYIRDHFAKRFRIREAGNGAEGIALARRHLPDVVLSDVMMPVADGHELVRALRASVETDFLSIILLTAQAGDEQRLQGLERGADEYLVKPFDMRELDVRVRNLIAARQRLRRRFTNGDEAPLAADVGLAPADGAYVERVRQVIRQRLGDPEFGVGELAEAMAQDRSNLFRRVRQLCGESPSDLIRQMRIEAGTRLLADRSGTVTDVAYAVGFNSLSHFCRCFHDVHGVTPAAYRTRVGVAR